MRSEFLIPYPPSVNSLYANWRGGGRKKTGRYQAWLRAAGWAVRTQPDRNNHHSGPVTFTLQVRRPDARKRDASNLLKAPEDLMVALCILRDDSQIVRSSAEWVEEGPEGARIVIDDINQT